MHKTSGFEDFKMASGIRNDMRSTATQLCKCQCLTRLVSKTGTGLRVSKQLVEAIAQDYRQNIQRDFTVTRRTELLQMPTATFHLFIILLNLWTLFIMADYPCTIESCICCYQDDMAYSVLVMISKANNTRIQGHLTRLPQVLNPLDTGNVLVVS